MPNPERSILPGQFTKVRVLLDVREEATVVPLRGVIIEKGGAYIYVMRQDSTVEKRFIELGPEIDNRAVVERGLVPGEIVVVEGQHKLTPGMKVRPVEESFDGETEIEEPQSNPDSVNDSTTKTLE